MDEIEACNQHHADPMRRTKEQIGQKIDGARITDGVLAVITDIVKGKNSSGFGMVKCTLGHGGKVGVVQFIKAAMATGEERLLPRFPGEISFHAMGEDHSWENPGSRPRHCQGERSMAARVRLSERPRHCTEVAGRTQYCAEIPLPRCRGRDGRTDEPTREAGCRRHRPWRTAGTCRPRRYRDRDARAQACKQGPHCGTAGGESVRQDGRCAATLPVSATSSHQSKTIATAATAALACSHLLHGHAFHYPRLEGNVKAHVVACKHPSADIGEAVCRAGPPTASYFPCCLQAIAALLQGDQA